MFKGVYFPPHKTFSFFIRKFIFLFRNCSWSVFVMDLLLPVIFLLLRTLSTTDEDFSCSKTIIIKMFCLRNPGIIRTATDGIKIMYFFIILIQKISSKIVLYIWNSKKLRIETLPRQFDKYSIFYFKKLIVPID